MAFVVVPSIDLRGGRVVRLKQGDYAQQTTYDFDPRSLARDYDRVIVEGVGGWMVPLADGMSTEDIPRRWDLPVILVVGIRLGCISHARLTARAIEADGCVLTAARLEEACLQQSTWVGATAERARLAGAEVTGWICAPALPHVAQHTTAVRTLAAVLTTGHLEGSLTPMSPNRGT